jgi:DNA-binding transcriptional MerR regulator
MFMIYTMRHITALFEVSHETVRNWTREFERHLSVRANPGKGKHRTYNDDDLQVFALISELKKQGFQYQDIHASLDNGQRGEPPLLPAEQVEALAIGEQQRQLTLQLRQLQVRVEQLQSERDDALAKLRPAEEKNIRLEALLEDRTKQLEEARREIRQLYMQVGRLQHSEDSDGE